MTATKKKRRKQTKKKTTRGRKKVAKKKASRKATDSKKPSWGVVTFEQIEGWRSKLGLSKSAMAEALQVTNSTYHNWRRGTTVPHPNQQHEILSRLQALQSDGSNESDGHTPTGVGSGAFRRAATRGRGPLRPAVAPVHEPVGTPVTATPVLRNDDAIGRITAAYIASQNEPVSAASVIEFIQQVRRALV